MNDLLIGKKLESAILDHGNYRNQKSAINYIERDR